MAGSIVHGFLDQVPSGWKVAADLDATRPSLRNLYSKPATAAVCGSCYAGAFSKPLVVDLGTTAEVSPPSKRRRVMDGSPSPFCLQSPVSTASLEASTSEHNKHTSSMDSLPDDLLLIILGHAAQASKSPADVISMLLTSRRMCHLGSQASILVRLPFSALHVSASSWSPAAYRFQLRCAQAGNRQAQYALGMIAFYCLNKPGWGLRLLAQSAVARCPEALYSLGVIHFNGSSGTKEQRDISAGVLLCLQAATLGHTDAMRELGHCLQDGYGVRRDSFQGRQLLTRANALDSAQAARLGSVGSSQQSNSFPTSRACNAQSCAFGASTTSRLGDHYPFWPSAPLTSGQVVAARAGIPRSISEPVHVAGRESGNHRVFAHRQQGANATVSHHRHEDHNQQCCCLPAVTVPLSARPDGWIRQFLLDRHKMAEEEEILSAVCGHRTPRALTLGLGLAPELPQQATEQSRQQRKLCSNDTCGRVELRDNEFRCCSACTEVRYCSRVCQAQDWKAGHKGLCPELAERHAITAALDAVLQA